MSSSSLRNRCAVASVAWASYVFDAATRFATADGAAEQQSSSLELRKPVAISWEVVEADELRRRRQFSGLSTLDLARKLEVTQQLVLQWESEDRFPTKRHCEALDRLLGSEEDSRPKR